MSLFEEDPQSCGGAQVSFCVRGRQESGAKEEVIFKKERDGGRIQHKHFLLKFTSFDPDLSMMRMTINLKLNDYNTRKRKHKSEVMRVIPNNIHLIQGHLAKANSAKN